MKKSLKKGFTIIELVVVMSIILIVTATAVVSYHRMTTTYKEKEYERIINTFEAAAEAYAAENQDIKDRIYSGAGYATVTLKVLGIEGLIDDEVEDPITGEKFDEKNYVSVYLDENRNFHAVYMKETGSSFTNSREKQSLLAGSYYGRVQMLEYIVGFVRGNYDEATGQYGTKEIDYSKIDIKITDTTDNRVLSDNSIIPTTREYIDHEFRIDYSFDFGDDGVKKLTRKISVYNIAPTMKSLTITPDMGDVYINKDITAMAFGESVHGSITYHFVVDGEDLATSSNTYTITENQTLAVYVEDAYGWKSDSVVRTIKNIDKTPPTFEFETSQDYRYGMFVKVINIKDNESGIPTNSMLTPGNDSLWQAPQRVYLNRNGNYTFKIRDKAGNVTAKVFKVENVLMDNLLGKEKAMIEKICKAFSVKCVFTGSTNKWATSTAQSIPMGTPVTDGMTVTITMTAPRISIKLNVTNGSVIGADNVEVDKGEGTTFQVGPYNGYRLNGATVVCDYGATATLNNDIVTVENVMQSTTCVVTMKKKPVSYRPSSGGGGGGGSSTTTSSCGVDCIYAKMRENGSNWYDADETGREKLHENSEYQADKLEKEYGIKIHFTKDGYWRDESGKPVEELYGKQ